MALIAVPLASCGSDDPDSGDTSSATGAGSETTGGSAASSGGDETTSSTSTTAAPTTTVDLATSLDGRTFLSTGVEGYQLVDGAQIQLTFDGTDIAAAGGCNQIASTWSLEGAVLVVAPPAMTMMACDPAALMDQDTWFSALLTSKPTVSVDGDELTITATDGTVVTFLDQSVANPDLPLEGTTWSVDGLVSGVVIVRGAPRSRSRQLMKHGDTSRRAVDNRTAVAPSPAAASGPGAPRDVYTAGTVLRALETNADQSQAHNSMCQSIPSHGPSTMMGRRRRRQTAAPTNSGGGLCASAGRRRKPGSPPAADSRHL